MNAAPDADLPAYHVGKDGIVRLNDAGQALREQHKNIEAQVAKLDRNWSDAVLAALFLRHPWVDTLTIEVSSNWGYNDFGDHYLSSWCRVEEVGIVACAALPGDILGDDGQVDLHVAALLLGDALDAAQIVNHARDLLLKPDEGSRVSQHHRRSNC
ncbi:MAG: hypothetical protein FWG56_02240 [Desulfovibrionaceae bacterium]|nr:hypothetical protein [Desulfovibrionaceae bacterium]